jgi:hypothetical protein
MSAFHIPRQLTPFEPQDLLARVIEVVDPQLTALGRELHHCIWSIGRNNNQVGLVL